MPDTSFSPILTSSLLKHNIESGAKKTLTIHGTFRTPDIHELYTGKSSIPVREEDQIIQIQNHIQTSLMRSHRIDPGSFNSFLNHLSNHKINAHNTDNIINHWERWNQLFSQNLESKSTSPNAAMTSSIFLHRVTIHKALIDYCNLGNRRIKDFMQFIKKKEKIKTDFRLLDKIMQKELTPDHIETYWNQYKASKIASLIKGFIPSKFEKSKMATEFTAFIIKNNQDPIFIQTLFNHSFIPKPTIDRKTEKKIYHQWLNYKKTQVESDVTKILNQKNSDAIPSFLTYLFKHYPRLFQKHCDLFDRLNSQDRMTTITELNMLWEKYKEKDESSPPHSPQYHEPTAPQKKPSDPFIDVRILDPFSWFPTNQPPATETPADSPTPNMNPTENCFDIQWITEPITTILNCFGPRET